MKLKRERLLADDSVNPFKLTKSRCLMPRTASSISNSWNPGCHGPRIICLGSLFSISIVVPLLDHYVSIVEALSPSLQDVVPFRKAPVSWSNESYYRNNMTVLFREHKVLHLTHAESRLANNGLLDEIQRLRCRANYHALKFTEPLQRVADALIKRMKSIGPFIALHSGCEKLEVVFLSLIARSRYEKNMLSFTGRTHGLPTEEARELKRMRYDVGHWKEKEIESEEKRRQGGCPLTPYETGLFSQSSWLSRDYGHLHCHQGNLWEWQHGVAEEDLSRRVLAFNVGNL
ncbi:hypothetical protein SELMODRAFT_403269 [Selaginella moellendorffii]|uniref:O-fucosyltransferase family protein n=1 Tax=Selaginella moellendorffii TaxID=88036 RepID=D8QTM0_SELML|nr:hypothetical protein SELMODRAFT_403269 [Selaginella moellendorffii]